MNLLAMNLMYTHLLAMIFIDSFTHSCLVTVVIYTECFIGIYIYYARCRGVLHPQLVCNTFQQHTSASSLFTLHILQHKG